MSEEYFANLWNNQRRVESNLPSPNASVISVADLIVFSIPGNQKGTVIPSGHKIEIPGAGGRIPRVVKVRLLPEVADGTHFSTNTEEAARATEEWFIDGGIGTTSSPNKISNGSTNPLTANPGYITFKLPADASLNTDIGVNGQKIFECWF